MLPSDAMFRFIEIDDELSAELTELLSGFPEKLGLFGEVRVEHTCCLPKMYQVRFLCSLFGLAQATMVSAHETIAMNFSRKILFTHLISSFWNRILIETMKKTS